MTYANTNLDSERTQKTLKGWHVLLIMLGFFGLMFTVNGIFLYHAITSFPGEDVKKSYVQGLNYNQTLDQRAQQAQLGWTAEAGLDKDQLIFRLRDEVGAPVLSHTVIGELRRLATKDDDLVLMFEGGDNGAYFADASNLTSGHWVARINVFDESADLMLFQARKQILVP